MTVLQFVFAILVLLCTPGPTNTLMALGGYERGWLAAWPLILGELCGYLAVIVPVATLAAPVFDAYPQAGLLAKLLAGVWILSLSYRLWTTRAGSGGPPKITVRQVALTTLLNPKALIIALVIMPHGGFVDLLPWLALFALLVGLAANGWILAGMSMRRATRIHIAPDLIRKTAAAFLLVFATILAGSSIHALA